MQLFEMVTSHVGESYVRCYVWAETEERARALFATTYPQHTLQVVSVLFAATAAEFITKLSDCGFE